MSLACIKLVKKSEGHDAVIYSVLSPDFSESGDLEEIAFIEINKTQKSHVFSLGEKLMNEKVIPPYFYEMAEDKREELLASEFFGYGYGAWTGRVMSQVRQMLNAGKFPAECL